MPLKPKKYSIRYLTSSQGYVRGGGYVRTPCLPRSPTDTLTVLLASVAIR